MTAETFFALFHQYGLILVCAVVFCEYMNLPGFPAGVIMPCIGVLIAQSELSLPLTVALSVVSGVLGSLVIYAVCAKKYGTRAIDVNAVQDTSEPTPAERAKMDREFHIWIAAAAIGCALVALLYLLPNLLG